MDLFEVGQDDISLKPSLSFNKDFAEKYEAKKRREELSKRERDREDTDAVQRDRVFPGSRDDVYGYMTATGASTLTDVSDPPASPRLSWQCKTSTAKNLKMNPTTRPTIHQRIPKPSWSHLR